MWQKVIRWTYHIHFSKLQCPPTSPDTDLYIGVYFQGGVHYYGVSLTSSQKPVNCPDNSHTIVELLSTHCQASCRASVVCSDHISAALLLTVLSSSPPGIFQSYETELITQLLLNVSIFSIAKCVVSSCKRVCIFFWHINSTAKKDLKIPEARGSSLSIARGDSSPLAQELLPLNPPASRNVFSHSLMISFLKRLTGSVNVGFLKICFQESVRHLSMIQTHFIDS